MGFEKVENRFDEGGREGGGGRGEKGGLGRKEIMPFLTLSKFSLLHNPNRVWELGFLLQNPSIE